MKYLLLLRGVNVGSKNRVRMGELRQMLMELGFQKVSTYINSGNALFESDKNPDEVHDLISSVFLPKFGFHCEMVIRSLDKMQAVVEEFPFSEHEIIKAQEYDPEVEHLYVYFTGESVDNYLEKHHTSGKQPIGVQVNDEAIDRIVTRDCEIYLLTHESVRKSKLALKLARLFPEATARNWNTVTKLTELLQGL